jgi:hypothetical protein
MSRPLARLHPIAQLVMGAVAFVAMVFVAMVVATPPLHAQSSTGARVQGVVFDSLGNRPLSGATVQVTELPPGRGAYSAFTDSLGRFHIDSVRPGSYLAGFLHPLLDSIGVAAPYDSVSMRAGATVSVSLAIPSARRLTRAICGDDHAAGKTGRASTADSVGMIVGNVRDANTGAPMEGTAVTLQWPMLIFGSGGPHTETRTLRATTTAEGWFAMCGIAVDDYQLHAEHARQETGLIDVVVHPHEIVRLSLLLGTDATAVATDSSSRGGSAISGTVVTHDKHPLEGVQVVVDGTAASAITDAKGAFRITGLPNGTRMAEARALGYEPVRVSVEPSRSEERTVSIVMAKRVTALEAVTVFGKQGTRMRDLTGFLDRKRRGFGRFITRQEIDQENAFSTCDLLRRVPGVRVLDDATGGCTANVRGATSGSLTGGPRFCEPTVYEDNIAFGGTFAELAHSVPPQDIMGIEVYTTATEPPQFQGACGSIVVWTRMGL